MTKVQSQKFSSQILDPKNLCTSYAWLCALPSTLNSIPLIITTLGNLDASVRTCKPLYAYVLPHNIPVSRLETLYVYLTTTYYLYIMRLRIGNTHRPVTAILGCKYGAKSMGGSICSHNRNVTLPHRVNSTHITE